MVKLGQFSLIMRPNLLPDNPPAKPSHLTSQSAFWFVLAVFLTLKLLLSISWGGQEVARASDLTADNILKAVNEQRVLRNLLALNTNAMLSSAAVSVFLDVAVFIRIWP